MQSIKSWNGGGGGGGGGGIADEGKKRRKGELGWCVRKLKKSIVGRGRGRGRGKRECSIRRFKNIINDCCQSPGNDIMANMKISVC